MSASLLAITMGDPAGVGPEIVARAAADRRLRQTAVPLVLGDPAVMRRAVQLVRAELRVVQVDLVSEIVKEPRTLCVMQGSAPAADPFEPGAVQERCGEASFRYIVDAIDLALAGHVGAVVTAPISKEALRLSGHDYPGHTEIFAERTGSTDFALMLADGPKRVVHATCHEPLAQALRSLSVDRILRTIRLASDACKKLGFVCPRVLVCALNPHAGESGIFGDEELRLVVPAVAAARKLDIEATGPVAADSAFVRAFSGEFDVVVALYHDQGHIPFKLSAFQAENGLMRSMRGVNLTLGLPIVRTSVDHGTAWNLAWKGVALADSMLDAVEMAVKLSSRPA